MTIICDTFKRLAHDTWNNIGASRSLNSPFKEETITDINILAIKKSLNSQVRTKVFQKNEEAVEGADWEWWFRGLTGNWIGFRVQAKIINLKSDKFEELHRRHHKTQIYQCDNLIERSLTTPHPKIPIYCFYIHTDNVAYLNNWRCWTFSNVKDFYGCAITSAFNVKKLQSTKRKHLTDLEPDLQPWHCLVCCSGYGNGDFISNIHAYAKNNLIPRDENAKELNVEIPINFISKMPPDYVLATFENESTIAPDDGIGGVIVIAEKE